VSPSKQDRLAKRYVAGVEKQPSDAVARGRARFAEKLAGVEAPEPRRFAWVAPALAFAAVAVVIGVVAWPEAPLQVVLRGHPDAHADLVQTAGQGEALDFSDGSEVVVQADSVLRVQQVGANGASVELQRGSAHVSVVHRTAKTKWNFTAGPYRVAVVGTRFELKWDPESGGLIVHMDEGIVEVDGPGLARQRVTTAQKLEAFASPARASIYLGPVAEVAAVAPPEITAPPRARAAATPAPVKQERARNTGPSWRYLANAGDSQRALEAAEQTGFAWLSNSMPQGDVLVLGDTAREAKNPARAREAWLAVRERFRGSEAAVQAAIRLGTLAFEAEHDHAQGRDFFRAAINEAPNAPSASLAMGRWLELLVQGRRTDEARAVAREYVGRFPNGAQVELARTVLSR
jgi:hypothetical protein